MPFSVAFRAGRSEMVSMSTPNAQRPTPKALELGVGTRGLFQIHNRSATSAPSSSGRYVIEKRNS